MIRKAVGTVISRTAVAATTKRTSGRLSLRNWIASGPTSTSTITSPIISTASSGTSVKTTLPGSVSRPHARETVVIVHRGRVRAASPALRRVQPKATPRLSRGDARTRRRDVRPGRVWTRRGEGDREQPNERTQRCVSEAAERATHASAVRAWPSFINPAHDRVEGGHDRHRVGHQVPGHQPVDRLEVDEARVVDPEPERLVRA